MNKAIVYIEEMDSVADVTFPAIPQVTSLLMYDDTSKTKDKPHPPNGYPVVCVTVSHSTIKTKRSTFAVMVIIENILVIMFQKNVKLIMLSFRPATRSTTTLIKRVPSVPRRTSTTLSLSTAGSSALPPGQME